jgi:transcription termination factor Rho
MTREKYESLPLATLKELAKARKMRGVSTLKKSDLINAMLEQDEKDERAAAAAEQEAAKAEAKEEVKEELREKKVETDIDQLDSGVTVQGILEVMPDGFGFIRSDNYLPGEKDVYVSPSQIRKFGLKTGDILCGNTRVKTQQEKFSALLYVSTINGQRPAESIRRPDFEKLTPIFPNKRIQLECEGSSTATRIVDLLSPIGKGQRGMIVSPPKAGKTTLLKEIALSVQKTEPDMHLLILLIDERPEEVTDIREAIEGPNVEVIYSTFDELPEHHKRVSEMVIERAKRLVEKGEDVMILLDSITRLARAYNLIVPPSGRTLSGGLDPAALHMPKRFFGAARNMREGGSLTILATALIETGSKMDDVVYEEFKGTGNMEVVLNRKLQEKRVFPAIDIPKSGTRRDDLLLTKEEQNAVDIIHKGVNGLKVDEAVENLLNMFSRTRSNEELVAKVNHQKFI